MYTIKNDAEMEIRHAQITNAEEARNPVCLRLPGHLTEIKKSSFNDIIIYFLKRIHTLNNRTIFGKEKNPNKI